MYQEYANAPFQIYYFFQLGEYLEMTNQPWSFIFDKREAAWQTSPPSEEEIFKKTGRIPTPLR
jgi:hypothetical protein